jgi:hypothetical protein
MAGEFALGTAVFCAAGATGEAYGCANQIGLVLESRRKHSRVFFPYNARVYWVPNAELRALDSRALAGRPREQRIVWLIAELRATDLRIEKFTAESVVVEIHHAALTAERLDELRCRMGDAYVRWTLQPAGQSAIASLVEFREGPSEAPQRGRE